MRSRLAPSSPQFSGRHRKQPGIHAGASEHLPRRRRQRAELCATNAGHEARPRTRPGRRRRRRHTTERLETADNQRRSHPLRDLQSPRRQLRPTQRSLQLVEDRCSRVLPRKWPSIFVALGAEEGGNVDEEAHQVPRGSAAATARSVRCEPGS